MRLETCLSILEEENHEDYEIYYEKIRGGMIKKLEISTDNTTRKMLDSKIVLGDIKGWTLEQKTNMKTFRDARANAKKLQVDLRLLEDENDAKRKSRNKQRLQQKVGE